MNAYPEFLAIVRIKDHVRVNISISNMSHYWSQKTKLSQILLDARDNLRQGRDGDANVSSKTPESRQQ